MDAYIICATPRTGSTLLCDLLSSTGVAGEPDSFFMRDPDPVWIARWELPDRRAAVEPQGAAAFLAAAARVGRGQTEIFGARLMQEDREDLMAMARVAYPDQPSDLARIRAAFGRVLFIHLTRADKLAQAVSLVRAEQSGLWHIAPDGSELERLAPPQPPQYDFARIEAARIDLARRDGDWCDWFDREGIRPLRLEYADLSSDPAGSVGQIFGALGLRTPDPRSLRPGVARLSDGLSAEWIARYRSDAARAR